ncbi:MAG: hypothetical protein JWP94_1647 [Mucilaginibacter sp.]|nr:hypothetical protein [Mucilaginibacter sp.]
MRILLAIETLNPGGAEAFVLRLADALQSAGHQVVLFSFYKGFYNKDFHLTNGPQATAVHAEIPWAVAFQKLDSALAKVKLDFSFTGLLIQRSLKKVLRANNIQVVHSHLFKTDRLCLSVASSLGIPVITTVHGDYLQFFRKASQGIHITVMNYFSKIRTNLNRLNRVICISDEQLNFFRDEFEIETRGKLAKIYNGYQAKPLAPGSDMRKLLGIPPGDFVFGMVSRGIPAKGWQVAIDAFLVLDDPRCHLVLVGDSNYLQKLAPAYVEHKRIHFTGHSDKPLQLINIFDVGLLPSTYSSESLPTAVIEYLYSGKPVISSDAGELRNMLNYNNQQAGVIIPIKEGEVPAGHFSNAMRRYLEDGNLYRLHQANTAACFSQFNMDKCVASYLEIYKQLTNTTN